MANGTKEWTLTEAARLLGEPQHRLIYLCEKGVVQPDIQDADGRGTSRRFSARNLLEFAVALKLRELEIGMPLVAAAIHVLRAFERGVTKQLRGFELPGSLRHPDAPRLNLVIADGTRLYFTLAASGATPRVYGGISLQEMVSERPSDRGLDRVLASGQRPGKRTPAGGIGGPEGSRFLRLELSVTELARELDLATT
jgi:hypothetical protein